MGSFFYLGDLVKQGYLLFDPTDSNSSIALYALISLLLGYSKSLF